MPSGEQTSIGIGLETAADGSPLITFPVLDAMRQDAAVPATDDPSHAEEEEEETPQCYNCYATIYVEEPRHEIAMSGRHVAHTYCEGCTFTCAMCDERRPICDRNATRDGYVCDECLRAHYTCCERCGAFRPDDEMSYSPHDDNPRCNPESRSTTCHERHLSEYEEEDDGNDGNAIDDYHEYARSRRTVLPSPWAESHHNRYFGVELEVEAVDVDREDAARRIRDAMEGQSSRLTANAHLARILYMEGDGSLDDGFEMISAPLGLDDQRRLWTHVLGNPTLVKGLRSHNTSTCGLHVHVSRASLTTTQIARMVMFLNRRENESLIRGIARRYTNEFCKVKNKQLDTAAECTQDRYEALNLCNSHTVEFRIFRGSLRPKAVLAAIEFAHAVAEHCRDDGGCGEDFSSDAFLAFIVSPRMKKDAQILRSYLLSRGFTLPIPTL